MRSHVLHDRPPPSPCLQIYLSTVIDARQLERNSSYVWSMDREGRTISMPFSYREILFRFYVEEKVVRIKRGRRRYLNRGMQSDDRRSSFDAPPLFAPCLAPVQIRSRATREQLFGNFIVSRPRAKLVMFFSSLQK